jgi:peptide-methionine (S)-S-oxide reductase
MIEELASVIRTRRSILGTGAGALAILVLGGLLWRVSASKAEEPSVAIPPPAIDAPLAAASGAQTVVLAGGCFWGVQGVFQHVAGVTEAVSGYSGGSQDTAQYHRVSEGDTGHAESVRITYDPHLITYGKLLQVYFSVAHNPTELNRQGPDEGTQYRSAIFVQTPEQKRLAELYIAQLDKTGVFQGPIVTKLEPFKAFYPAEDYHQNYLTLHPNQPYIAYNDIPKVENLKVRFPELYRDKPVLVVTASN